MISAKIIKHSTSWLGIPLISFVLEYPRYIHGELLTHRVFSKNSASSRAIPFAKFVDIVQKDPTKPLWTNNQKGMQGPIITDERTSEADYIWLMARDLAIDNAIQLDKLEIHKQNVNRLLEPWMHIKIILTGTDFGGWYELRDHEKAHPEIRELAKMMRHAMDASTPQLLKPGEWHVPFDDRNGVEDAMWCGNNILKASVARCARVSYNNFDGNQDIGKDLILFDRLFSEEPRHCSPAEHQARVPYPNELQDMQCRWLFDDSNKVPWFNDVKKYFSNLRGWIQLRKLIECNEFS